MTTLAQVLDNYRQTMPEAGAGLSAGVNNYLAGKELKAQSEQTALENQTAANKEQREIAKDERETGKFAIEQQEKMAAKAMATLNALNTQEKWVNAQESGIAPLIEGYSFGDRDKLIMATMAAMSESDRMGREKEATRKGEKERDFQYQADKDSRAFELDKRRTDAYVSKTSGAGDGGDGGLDASGERYIASRVAGLFDGVYDVATGTISIRDDAGRRLAQRIIDHATRLKKGNPALTLSQAVSEAAQRNGIEINAMSEPAQSPAEFNYIPGQGLVPVR